MAFNIIKKVLGMEGDKLKTDCGGMIVIPNKVRKHLQAHPNVQKILGEAVGKIRLPIDGSFLATEIEMGRIVGFSGCVKTPKIKIDNSTLFAQRKGRKEPSRVTFDKGEKTTKVVILASASKESDKEYILMTSWIGSLAQKEPWDPYIKNKEEYQKSLDFWTSHALVYDPKVMGKVFESAWKEVLK